MSFPQMRSPSEREIVPTPSVNRYGDTLLPGGGGGLRSSISSHSSLLIFTDGSVAVNACANLAAYFDGWRTSFESSGKCPMESRM